ncbi:MAG: hypothetical protein IKW74_07660, partial [Thermoguttaceae bacterium]|nr:hypothetical protein [Thermoguttaceae bacterium]
MQEVVFKPGIAFQSNTVYHADRTVYDIELSDTVRSSGHGYCLRDKELAIACFLHDLENVTIDLN